MYYSEINPFRVKYCPTLLAIEYIVNTQLFILTLYTEFYRIPVDNIILVGTTSYVTNVVKNNYVTI